MEKEAKPIRFNRHLRLVLEELQKNTGPIYQISTAKAKHLVKMGFLTRPDPRGPYQVTPLVNEILAQHPPEAPKQVQKTATEQFVDHVQTLQRRVHHDEVIALLKEDTARGIDTSPKIMRSKGRRSPRRIRQ